MKLSFFVATRNGSSRNPPGTFAATLRQYRELGDELVVVVDDTTSDDTFDVAKEVTPNVHLFVHDPLFIEMHRQAFSRCRGDWIFAADDDDRLSSNWTRPLFDALMRNRPVTHYWVPTRYLVDAQTYISTAPYIGHFSVQLFRNIESIAVLPRNLHQQLAIAGEPVYLCGLWMDAMNFAWHDRASREAKLAIYEEAHDEAHTNFDQRRFYLYEDYYFETEAVEDERDAAVLQQASAESGPGVSVRILRAPIKMTVGQTYWVAVRLINNSARVLLPQSEFIRWGQLSLSYRWNHGESTPQDPQTPFPARIAPGFQHDALVRVKAPSSPGSYALSIDILEEQTARISEASDAGTFETRKIEVRPLTWRPVTGERA